MTHNKLAERLILKIEHFPTLPTVVSRIIQVTSDPNGSLHDIKKIIEADSAMVVEVLKLANSPFYGLRRKVSSIDHCISLLGMEEIKNLVLSRAMFQTYRKISGLDTSILWRHSFYCGLAAKALAHLLDRSAEEFFVAGLIHDVGKLLIYMELEPQQVKELEFQRPINLDIARDEIQLLGIGHDQLGLRLLQKWMFPAWLTQAVGYHHRPMETPGDFTHAFIVYLADMLSHILDDEVTEAEISLLKERICSDENCRAAEKIHLTLDDSFLQSFETLLQNEALKEAEIIAMLTSDNKA